MSTITVENINNKINESKELINSIQANDFGDKIKELNISWDTWSINTKSDLIPILIAQGFVNKKQNKLTKLGLLFFGRITIDIEHELLKNNLQDNKYEILKSIQIGKNSCTFLAKHISLGTLVVLKYIRPGAAENIAESIRIITSDRPIPSLVQPYDYFKTEINDIFSKILNLECLVFPYIKGETLKAFLNKDNNTINAYALAAFIKQVGSVLMYLEKKGAYHGDLHEENIIVNVNSSGYLQYNVIDVSFGLSGSLSFENSKNTDLAYFRQHIWNFLSAQQTYLTKMSLRKHLGSEIFFIVNSIMINEVNSFSEICSLFNYNPKYEEYKLKKNEFIQNKFNPPGNFKLQRYEEITDQAVALKLFVPFPEIMQQIRSFSNIIISGTRGSGKSTYLAAVAFFPKVDFPLVSYRETFGVYFPCRQGEFRLLSNEMINYEKVGIASVKPVLIVKIIRRTLESLAEGIEFGKLSKPDDYSQIKRILSLFLNGNEIISLEQDIVSEIRNMVSTMVRVEMKVIDSLFNSKQSLKKFVASELTLLEFFKAIKNSFKELLNTRFHLLFDDAGVPNIPDEVQCIINDLIVSSNSLYCVKLSTEKNSYKYQTTSSKQLENGHDYFEYDINAIFYTGSKTYGLDDRKLEKYFREIVKNRLLHFNYQSDNIIDYVGDDEIKLENLINSLATGRRNAYYSGWTMVWRIAGGNTRNLLELISEIFSVADINEKSHPALISYRNQDRAIRSVSLKRLRSISQISGFIKIHGKDVSLGKRLFDITLVLGSVFRIYLLEERGKHRKDQYLAIERNELNELDNEADFLLKEMIKYGILDDSRLDISRDDRIKKPIYILNRILCPAFSISYRRDQHLRLSRQRLEQLLLNPSAFVVDGTKRLRNNAISDNRQITLFDELNDERQG